VPHSAGLGLAGLGFYLLSRTRSPWWGVLLPAVYMLAKWRWQQATENKAAVR
jgi:hypothetical protein